MLWNFCRSVLRRLQMASHELRPKSWAELGLISEGTSDRAPNSYALEAFFYLDITLSQPSMYFFD